MRLRKNSFFQMMILIVLFFTVLCPNYSFYQVKEFSNRFDSALSSEIGRVDVILVDQQCTQEMLQGQKDISSQEILARDNERCRLQERSYSIVGTDFSVKNSGTAFFPFAEENQNLRILDGRVVNYIHKQDGKK